MPLVSNLYYGLSTYTATCPESKKKIQETSTSRNLARLEIPNTRSTIPLVSNLCPEFKYIATYLKKKKIREIGTSRLVSIRPDRALARRPVSLPVIINQGRKSNDDHGH
ncbi:33827_t:CDS:2 [Gigaspora margarita]|uniref:33827_t:CDS:1 n=1 Tax=Gigaspora margarita TaxID=4874 RepID=A0ABN7V0Y7_GIGMA|nr:33827_t:CDS:2 [Gigaspora margarita]